MTPTAIDTTSSTPQPMGRAMFGPEVTRFVALRKAMEDRWIPEMQRLLSIADHDLPLLWDADFLFRPGEAISDGSYALRSEEHTSELQSLMRISYAVFCLKKKKTQLPKT